MNTLSSHYAQREERGERAEGEEGREKKDIHLEEELRGAMRKLSACELELQMKERVRVALQSQLQNIRDSETSLKEELMRVRESVEREKGTRGREAAPLDDSLGVSSTCVQKDDSTFASPPRLAQQLYGGKGRRKRSNTIASPPASSDWARVSLESKLATAKWRQSKLEEELSQMRSGLREEKRSVAEGDTYEEREKLLEAEIVKKESINAKLNEEITSVHEQLRSSEQLLSHANDQLVRSREERSELQERVEELQVAMKSAKSQWDDEVALYNSERQQAMEREHQIERDRHILEVALTDAHNEYQELVGKFLRVQQELDRTRNVHDPLVDQASVVSVIESAESVESAKSAEYSQDEAFTQHPLSDFTPLPASTPPPASNTLCVSPGSLGDTPGPSLSSQEKLKSLEDKIIQLEAANEELKSSFLLLKSEHARCDDTLLRSRMETAALLAEMGELALVDHREEETRLNELQSIEKELQTLKLQLNDSVAENEKLRTTISEQDREMLLQANLFQAQKADASCAISLERNVSSMSVEIENLRECLSRTTESLESTERQLLERSDDCSMKDLEIAQIRNDYVRLEESCQRLRAQVEDKAQKLMENEAIVKPLGHKLFSLSSQLAAKDEEISKFEAAQECTEVKLMEMTREKDRLIQEFDTKAARARLDIESMQRKIASLELELTSKSEGIVSGHLGCSSDTPLGASWPNTTLSTPPFPVTPAQHNFSETPTPTSVKATFDSDSSNEQYTTLEMRNEVEFTKIIEAGKNHSDNTHFLKQVEVTTVDSPTVPSSRIEEFFMTPSPIKTTIFRHSLDDQTDFYESKSIVRLRTSNHPFKRHQVCMEDTSSAKESGLSSEPLSRDVAIIRVQKFMRDFIKRRNFEKKQASSLHVVRFRIIDGKNLFLKGFSFFTSVPDAYVVINTLVRSKKKFKPVTVARSSIAYQSNHPQWNEDLELNVGCTGVIVCSVFSSSLYGDSFLGQASINTSQHPELYANCSNGVILQIPLQTIPVYPIYSTSSGQEIKVVATSENSVGSTHPPLISIAMHAPKMVGNVCGWFTEMQSGFLGTVVGTKIWVVLCDGIVSCYESPNMTNLLRRIECKYVIDVKESVYSSLEIRIEVIHIQLGPPVSLDVGSELVWAWAFDTESHKERWFRAFKCTHGSGYSLPAPSYSCVTLTPSS